ncbi:MAG: amidase family protein, partial [Planctomycetota bacterium]
SLMEREECEYAVSRVFDMLYSEFAQVHAAGFRAHGDRYCEETASAVEKGLGVDRGAGEESRRYQGFLRSRYHQRMEVRGVDLLVTPGGPPAPAFGGSSKDWGRMTYLPTFAGLPCLLLPSGKTRDGLPLGIHFVGRFHEDEKMLLGVEKIERALGLALGF